ncbi:MAG: O-antigen ligase family protein [Verrucomicrobiota bacterium]
MEPKFIIFWAVFLTGIPLGTLLCIRIPFLRYLTLGVMVWCTAEPDLVGINFFSREFYRAMTRGIEISLADLCAWVLFFSLIFDKKIKVYWFPPTFGIYFLYLFIAIFGWITAVESLPVSAKATYIPYSQFETNLYPLFEITKILRGILVFWVVANLGRDPKAMRAIIWGLVITVLYLTYIVLRDRYLLGINRVKATLGHPNTLATYMALMATLLFACAVSTREWIKSFFGYLFPAGCAALCVLMTISRGGLMAMAAGMGLAFTFLSLRNISLKNTLLVLLGGVMGTFMLALAADTLMNRFFGEQDAASDLEYRGKYNDQAKLMAEDYAWGVGAGNFSAWSFEKYAEIIDESLPPGTPPHNLWFLTLGELGWPGLVVFVLFWIRLYQVSIPFVIFERSSIYHTMACAAVSATLAGHLQNALQLGFRQSPLFFLNHICMGMMIAAYWVHKDAKKANAELPQI